MPDVIIIGGGPAGSTMGCYLSDAGIDNLILERANHPRPHVGESMVTATTRIFDEIDFLGTMEAEGFPHKYGASWHPITGTQEFDIAFREFPQEGVNQDYTYHLDRARFDNLMLKHAESKGSKVAQGVNVRDVVFNDEGYACGVTGEVHGAPVSWDAKVVVDASGRDTLLGRKLGLKTKDPIFDQFAVHAWYEDVDRGDGESQDYIHIYFLPVDRGWAWRIPITDKITSIGVVAERPVFKESKHGVEEYMDRLLNSNPVLAQHMAPARRINELKQEGNYSYKLDQFCGPGYVILGDAARFVDPIFSSGVSVAMHSAKFAAPSVIEAVRSGDAGHAQFQPYEDQLKQGVAIWYEFIQVYYRCLPIFTRFIQDPEHRLDLLRLLQGDVYDRSEVPVLARMKEAIDVIEQTEGHLLKSTVVQL